MQHKTVQVEHFQGQTKRDSLVIDQKYEEIINKEAMEGCCQCRKCGFRPF